MRTTKRFTPVVLNRFRRQERGLGVFGEYRPWHRVGRGDPASLGRSHLQQWNTRQREVLSDIEWVGFFFSTMLHNLCDSREQIPLSLGEGRHELSAYRPALGVASYPGTLALAKKLGIKHPQVAGNGERADWVMSTDQLLALKQENGGLSLLAVAFKPDGALIKKRTVELLALEREYWFVRGVPWLLITPAEYDARVALTLRTSMPWALGGIVSESDQLIATSCLSEHYGCSLTYLLERIATKLGSWEFAQRAFWQAVWSGKLPIDLRRGWRPHLPVVLLSSNEFLALNPIASRRSAWI